MGVSYGPLINFETLTWTTSATVTVTSYGVRSTSIFKTSGTSGWDAEAYASQPFTAPCTIQFKKQAASGDNGLSYAMIGWNEDPTANASYASIDHAAYPYAASAYIVYNNGTQIAGLPAWNPNNMFFVVYDTDGLIRHYNGSTLLYTSASYGTGKTVYVDSSYYIAGSANYPYNGFTNIAVVKKSWNGLFYAR